MKITIKDKEIELTYTFRSMIYFENVTGNTFTNSNVTDVITYFYCTVMASTKDFQLDFEEFVDWLDANPTSLNEFSEWLVKEITNQNTLKKD